MHNNNEIDEGKDLPKTLFDCNATKEVVDGVEQLCQNYSVQKRTKRWPLAYFYNCLYIAVIDSMVIFRAKFPQRKKKPIIHEEYF